MREIKFRAWDKHQILEVQQAKDDDTDVILMHSTGLRDINGVDIYEGDIVVYGEEDYPLVVEYNDAMARFECIGQEDVDYTFENFSASRELRVVGNIFQHKERLDIESDRL